MPVTRHLSRPHSLKGWLTILFAALAIPLLLLQGWWSYHDYQSAREQAWSDALAFADAVDLSVRQFMEQSKDLLMASARESGRRWLESEACSAEIASLGDLVPFDNVLVVTSQGRIVCTAHPVGPDVDVVDTPWFDDFTARAELTVGPLVYPDFGDRPVVRLVAPIEDEEGRLVGGLVAALPSAELSRLLGAFRPPSEQLTTLTTADGTVIARSADAENRVGGSIPPPTGSDRLIAPGRWIAEGPDLTGVPRTWGQVQTESGWIVYVGVPDALVLGPALREALAHMGGTLLIVLLGFFLAALSYRRIAGALRELTHGTRVSEAGELIPLPPDTPEEIAEVVEQFNATLEARVRAEAAERGARERYQSIFDNAVFGIYVSSADGRFLQVNPALVRMLGYESEEGLISVGPEALYADPRQRLQLVEASIAAGNVQTEKIELDWVRADGTPIIVRVSGKMLEDDGAPLFEMIVQDATEEKHTEDQLRQTQKMEAIGQLAGGVAHDFNNLLTVIGGNVELLEADIADGDPLRHDLAQIAKATRRASSLTRRLLTFSRRAAHTQELVDVDDMVAEMATLLVPVLGENLELRTKLNGGARRVSMDPGDLEQVILNLVLNARDAVRGEGSIVIETRDERDRRDGSGHDGVSVAVIDDGVGMDPEIQSKIFEPFFSTKERGEGTGLGLSTVYGIVTTAEGEISVESEPNRGTRIEIWLPACVPPEAAPPPEREATRGSADETVLVVEDDLLVRRFVERALQDGGYHVISVGSGDKAVRRLERGLDADLVLTDVVMPGLGAPGLANAVARLNPGTPILFMSGYIDNEFLLDELEGRPEILIRKPFTATELLGRVRAALDRASAGGTPSRV